MKSNFIVATRTWRNLLINTSLAIRLKGLCDCFSSLRSQNIIQCQRKRFLRYEFESMTMRAFTMCLLGYMCVKLRNKTFSFMFVKLTYSKDMRLVNYINYVY